MSMLRLFIQRYFCSEIHPSSWRNAVEKALNSFPYCYHPRMKIQTIVPQNQQQISLKQQANAFFELMKSNSIYGKAKKVQENQQVDLQKIEKFNDYFQPKLNQLIQRIKDHRLTSEKRFLSLKILFFIQESNKLATAFQKLPVDAIIDLKLEAIMIYAGICIKLDKDCLQLIQIISSQLEMVNSGMFETSKALIMIPNFWQYFPQKVIKNCITALQKHISKMDPIQMIVIIRYLYLCPWKLCAPFIQELTSHIKNSDQLINHIPLLLKTIKIRSHHHMDNRSFSQFFQSNPKKFSTILLSKNTNKEVFFPLLTINKANLLQNEYRQDFQKFALQIVKDLQKAEQIDLEETLRTIKLLMKYYVNLNSDAKYQITEVLLKKIIPVFEDPQITLFCLLLACRFSDVEKQFRTDLIKSFEKVFKICHQMKPGQTINLCYQVYRLKLDRYIKTPSIFSRKFDYSNSQLTPHELTYYFYLIKKTKESQTQKLSSVETVSKQLMQNLEKGKFTSLQSIYTVIDGLAKIQYKQNKYVWVNIQKAIQNVLYKNGSRNLLRKDLVFLSAKMHQAEFGSRKLHLFIQESIKDYSKIDENLNEYLQKAQKHHIWRQRYRRDKRNNQQP